MSVSIVVPAVKEYPHAIQDVQTVPTTAGASLELVTELRLRLPALRARSLYTSAGRHHGVGPEEKANTSAGWA